MIVPTIEICGWVSTFLLHGTRKALLVSVMQLAELIRQAGMTQAYVAERLGMNPSWFNRICLGRGMADLRMSKLKPLAEALRMSVGDVARALTDTKGTTNGETRSHTERTIERSDDD